MEQPGSNAGTGGPANTPPVAGTSAAMRTAADHRIPPETSPSHGAAARGTSETERELERTRDKVAEAAAPVLAEKSQEAIKETANRVMEDPEVKDQIRRTATAAQHDAKQAVKDKMGEAAGRAEDRINDGMNRTADQLDNMARRLDSTADERLSGSGAKARAGDLAHSLADTMESVSGYLRSNDMSSLQKDLERQVRERPLQTLLIGVAAGWMVGKILR